MLLVTYSAVSMNHSSIFFLNPTCLQIASFHFKIWQEVISTPKTSVPQDHTTISNSAWKPDPPFPGQHQQAAVPDLHCPSRAHTPAHVRRGWIPALLWALSAGASDHQGAAGLSCTGAGRGMSPPWAGQCPPQARCCPTAPLLFFKCDSTRNTYSIFHPTFMCPANHK